MKLDNLEKKLASQPWREVPAAWRQEILSAARAAATTRAATTPATGIWEQLAGLLWPSPKAWAGLAAAWVIMIGLNLTLAGSATGQFPASVKGVQVAHNWQQQQRLMSELLDLDNAATAQPPAAKPSPRSERQFIQRHG